MIKPRRYGRRRHRRKHSLVSKLPWQVNLALSPSALSIAYFNADVVPFVAFQISNLIGPGTGVFKTAQMLHLPLTVSCTYGAGVVALVTGLHGMAGMYRGVCARLSNKKHMGNALQTAQQAGSLQGLSWRGFEYLTGQYFKDQGYSIEIGCGTQDGGVDVEARDKSGRKVLIQCKHWKTTNVGASVVREMIGAMKLHGADGGVIVCSDRFTRNAHEEAGQLGIQLVEGYQLMRYVNSSSK